MQKIFALLMFAFVFFAANMTLSAQDGYAIGDHAIDFELKGVDGQQHSLAGIEDAKGYIVVFTCNHCPFAKMYEDRLIALHRQWAPKGYPVVAINPNDPDIVPEDSFENMVERSEEKGFPFLYLMDEKQEVFPAYGATKTPHVYLLDEAKKVRYIGAIDDNARNPEGVTARFLHDAIAALDQGEDPDPALTKAVGCSIKSQ